MNSEDTLKLEQDRLFQAEGNFIWMFGKEFFIETAVGNYVWSSPDYNGTNEIRKITVPLETYQKQKGIPFGRCKGRHRVGVYVGQDARLVDPARSQPITE